MEDLNQLKAFAHDNSVPIIQDGGLKVLLEYIQTHPVKHILEIGTAIGYSAMQFAAVRDDIFVDTIEFDIDRYHQAFQNVHDAGLDDRITVYIGDALTFNFDRKFDLIFIDAAKSQYINYFEHFKNNLAEGGVFFSDNLFFHGMVQDLSLTNNYSTKKLVLKLRKYVEFLRCNEEFNTEFFETGDGVAISSRKVCVEQRVVSVERGCFWDEKRLDIKVNGDAACGNPDAACGNPDAACEGGDASCGNPDAACEGGDAACGSAAAPCPAESASAKDSAEEVCIFYSKKKLTPAQKAYLLSKSRFHSAAFIHDDTVYQGQKFAEAYPEKNLTIEQMFGACHFLFFRNCDYTVQDTHILQTIGGDFPVERNFNNFEIKLSENWFTQAQEFGIARSEGRRVFVKARTSTFSSGIVKL